MKNLRHTIDSALRNKPDYGRLDNLSEDVWKRIRASRKEKQGGLVIPTGFKVATLVLSLLAFVALSQVSFRTGRYQADLFDLRYFSYQSEPTLNLALVDTNEFRP